LKGAGIGNALVEKPPLIAERHQMRSPLLSRRGEGGWRYKVHGECPATRIKAVA